MIVRTYKRRNRGGGGSGSLLSSDGDDEFSFMGGRGPFSSQEEEGDMVLGASTSSSSFWSSSQQDHFSFGSSQGSDEGTTAIASLRTSSIQPPPLPPQEPQHPSSFKGKSEKSFAAGQKLSRAGTLLSLKKNSTRENSNNENHGKSLAIAQMQVRTEEVTEGLAASSAQIAGLWGPCAPPTSTLMEAQESGEMMEHVDEANFAMDGLRPGQPMRIRRASLVSLLSICGTTQRRRLLRTHGMVKPVLDAILTVPIDDPPTALAAAALLYVMACDGQDEDFLGSLDCIQFLMKLLGPTCPPLHDKKTSCLGSRLLSLCSKTKAQTPPFAVNDQGGAHVVDKVNHLLFSMKSWGEGVVKFDDPNVPLPANSLSSEWVALLTLEKACLSTVVLEDNAGSVRRIGGHFKERLRELGGLDALSELAASCFLNLREVAKVALKTKNDAQSHCFMEGSRGVGMLLRCLKVMENVTFLSEENQKHLLDMVLLKDHIDSPHTFVGVVIGVISLISDIILALKQDHDQLDEAPNIRPTDKNAYVGRLVSNEKKATSSGHPSSDRAKLKNFDFDELDWSLESESTKKIASKKPKRQMGIQQHRDSLLKSCDSKHEAMQSSTEVCTSDASVKDRMGGDAHEMSLLEECLLSAVKVLMNLTNDNDLGCCQVAAGPGLDTMASLIVKHYPSFQSLPPEYGGHGKNADKSPVKEKIINQPEPDLDLLVVVLGVLVNLVEKDVRNRGRLAALNVGDIAHGMIQLLCFIFLSKEGAGKSVEETEGKFEIDEETSFREGQQEAEDMIVEAYSALLLAFLAKEGLQVQSTIGGFLPKKNLSILVPVLERFLAFHLSLNMLSAETHATVRDVIESCKQSLL